MPVTFQRAVLPNGLRIVAEIDPEASSAAAGFFVRTGARDEPAGLMGVSHFLEHMMFKGTEDLTAEGLNQAFDDLGARNNAYTSNEMTVFHAHVLPEAFDDALSLLARMMRPALRAEDFETERGVILQEIAMYMDNPFWVLYEEAVDRHYRPHALRHRILGTRETIGAMERDAMRGYFEQRYSADNTVLAVAGRLDFDHLVRRAEALCGHWARTGAGREPGRPVPNCESFTLTLPNVSRAYALMIADAPAMDDPDRYPAALIAQVLGSGDNSRLHWALIETGIAEEAMAGYEPHDGVGEFFAYASGDPERIGAIVEAVEREADAVAGSIDADDLERVRNKLATAATLGGERPSDRMQRLGRLITLLDRYTPLEEELERIGAVTLEDVRRVAARYPMRPRTTGVLRPSGAAGASDEGD